MRNADSAGGPCISSMRALPHFFSPGRRRIQRHRKLRDVGARLQGGDLADAVLLHLIDAQHRMHGQEGALDPGELALDALLGRVDHHRGALPEHQFLHLDEAEQLAVADLAGVHLVNLALIHEHNPENVTGCHGSARGSLLALRLAIICPGAPGTLDRVRAGKRPGNQQMDGLHLSRGTMLRLKIVSDQRRSLAERSSAVFSVEGGTIGRSADNDWVLPDPSRYVSAHHARVQFREGHFYLQDVSTNGVYVNDEMEPLAKRGSSGYRLATATCCAWANTTSWPRSMPASAVSEPEEEPRRRGPDQHPGPAALEARDGARHRRPDQPGGAAAALGRAPAVLPVNAYGQVVTQARARARAHPRPVTAAAAAGRPSRSPHLQRTSPPPPARA